MSDTKKLFDDAIRAMEERFKTVQTGRAHPNIFDKVEVIYYDTPTPLKSVAQVSAPNATEIVIAPYDKSSLKDIEKAIFEADMGYTPTNDGEKIRISVPPLSEERRKDLVKQVKAYGEDAKISVRNIRKEALDDLKDSDLSEDEIKRGEKDIQDLVNDYNKKIDTLVDEKNKNLLSL